MSDPSVIPSLNGLPVLVLGGSGFIGRHVVDCLASRGADVRVLDIAPPEEGSQSASRWVVGSASDEALVASLAHGCQAVICLATSSLPASANADLAAEIRGHVETTVRVAETVQKQGVKTFVFPSSGGTVYGIDSPEPLREDGHTQPRNAYGVSKLAIEHYLRLLNDLRDIKTVSMRIANPFGEGQRALRNQGFIAAAMRHAMTGEPLSIWGDGSVVRDFVYVRDVADALCRACVYDGPETLMNVGSGEGRSLLEAVRAVEAATGRRIELRFEPDRAIDVAVNVLDITRAREALSWAPAHDFDQAMQATAAWWLAQTP